MWLRRCATVTALTVTVVALPAVDLAQAQTPHEVSGSTRSVPLAAPVAATKAGAGRSLSAAGDASTATAVVTLPVSGHRLVGVTFPGGRPSASAVQVRTHDSGGWSAWVRLEVSIGDTSGSESAGAVPGSDPLWVDSGSTDQLQISLPRADGPRAALQIVGPGTSSADASVVATGPAATAAAATLGMPKIHTRAEWGADESLRRCPATYNSTIKAAVVHHTADSNGYTQAEVPAVMRSMYRYHTVSRGWCDLGYNFVVDKFGGLWEGRAGGVAKAVVGAHAGGFNADTFGVSMMGDYSTVVPSAAMLEAAARVIAWKFSLYGLKVGTTARLTSAGGGTARYAAGTTVSLPSILGHRNVGYTACPGDAGYARLGTIRSRVAALLASIPAPKPSDPVSVRAAALGSSLGAKLTAVASTSPKAGLFANYAKGSIYWSKATGAVVVRGAIRDWWRRLGSENSRLGFPTRDQAATPTKPGLYQLFQHGVIYWTAGTGAHAVQGAILSRYASLGYEKSPLGFPTRDQAATPKKPGVYQLFQHGVTYWTSSTGAHTVQGAILGRYASLGYENSRLGFPTSDQHATATGIASDFQHGSIAVNRTTGAVTVTVR